MQTSAQYYRDYIVEDQRFAASRPDVLAYSGEPLAEDVTITGPIKPELNVSTTGTDADWVVKAIDVYPDDSPDPKTTPDHVQVQSSWFPLFDRNPQTFCDIPKAREKDFRKATHRFYRSTRHPSGVWLRVLSR
jgi:predicted acyl esterase